ncbi:unnamed protein product [Adineta ricciae]|uniref:C2 domain-containing protein n=1 Tax=Adineta ricciae TaxID=249248 RepID=A0A816EFX5_ADIRI|nr:unnamed protein product [Adineta ricciae]
MENDELQRHARILNQKWSERNNVQMAKQLTKKVDEPFPLLMIVTLISSLAITIVIVGLAISRYHARRQKQTKNLTYSVTRYRRRPLVSTSCDSFTPSPTAAHDKLSMGVVNETTHIIKNSSSWPDTSLLSRADNKQIKSSSLSSSSSSSMSTSSTIEHINELPSLTFGLRWNEINKSLIIRVVSARDLFIHRHNRQPSVIDSYVRIELLSPETINGSLESIPSMRTHIVKKHAYPVYDEVFEFNNFKSTVDEEYSLLFTVSTFDTFTRDEVLGEITFPINFSILSSTEMTFTQELTARQRQLTNQQLGQMLLSLCYQPSDSALTFIVLKASNLPRIATTRLINPYFKIYMFYKKQRIAKRKSTIKRTTQSPVYNECFTFNIPNNEIECIHFDIILFDYDRHMKHEPIGIFSIGKQMDQHWNDFVMYCYEMFSLSANERCFRTFCHCIARSVRYLRNDRQRPAKILDSHANVYRPEVESELEHLAVATSRNKSLQINYEKELERKRQRSIRYHVLRRKYVAHPNDIQINPYVKNHMQFLRKNYPSRWTVDMLAESFNQSVENVRLILQQRTTRRLRVRARPPSSLFGVKDEEEREKIIREHIMKRDLSRRNRPELANTDDDNEPVDHQVLAEESHLLPRQRPSDDYMKRDVS